MGSGYYSRQLPFAHWYEFNCAIRVHQNFVEQLPMMLCILLLGGLYYPYPAAATGALNCLTRPLMIAQYLQNGPEGRKYG